MVAGDCLDLSTFADHSFVRVRHRKMDWATGWNSILRVGLYQKGPDVSEVGSTWLENLDDMRALRPFSAAELHALGGKSAFLESAWPRSPEPEREDPRLAIGIPWMLDTRLFLYRRDLLAKAGIPETIAFSTPEAVYDTLCRLRETGAPYPLAMATGGLSIHNMAGWVWGRGGHFRSEDYRKIGLVELESRRGMEDYFRLHPFIHPDLHGQDYTHCDGSFFAGHAVVLFSGQWAMKTIKDRSPQVEPAVADSAGYTVPPGTPWLGATHLVVWRHSPHEQDGLNLVAHLTSPETLARVFKQTGNIPARTVVLDQAPFATDPDYRLVRECLQRGRAFRSARLWAGVEMRLNTLHDQLWTDLFADPGLDLPAEIERRVRELAARLEKTLLANW
jgi:multiple sugar transport system substrate-binding protein